MNRKIKKTIFDKIDKLEKEKNNDLSPFPILCFSTKDKDKVLITKLQADNFESFIEKYIDRVNIKEYAVSSEFDKFRKKNKIPIKYSCIIDLFTPESNYDKEYEKSKILNSFLNYMMDPNFVEEMKNRGYENIIIDYPYKLITFDVIK